MAVADPAAQISIEPLCAPERHGHCLRETCVDPRRCGRSYRYAYGNCITEPRPCNSVTGVCRIDVTTGDVLTWSDAPAAIPSGPPAFLPRPGAHPDDELDGVVLVDCMGADGRAFFVILDGRTFAEVARAVAPHRHCIAFCSTWVWDAVLR